jgi:hypothetical protein
MAPILIFGSKLYEISAIGIFAIPIGALLGYLIEKIYLKVRN